MSVQNAAAFQPVAKLSLALLAIGWVLVRLVQSESVEHTALLVVRLIEGMFSFPLISVVRLVHLHMPYTSHIH